MNEISLSEAQARGGQITRMEGKPETPPSISDHIRQAMEVMSPEEVYAKAVSVAPYSKSSTKRKWRKMLGLEG